MFATESKYRGNGGIVAGLRRAIGRDDLENRIRAFNELAIGCVSTRSWSMPAPTGIYGGRLMTAISRTCSPSRARSRRRLLINCRQNFRHVKRTQSNVFRQAISAHSIFTRTPKIF